MIVGGGSKYNTSLFCRLLSKDNGDESSTPVVSPQSCNAKPSTDHFLTCRSPRYYKPGPRSPSIHADLESSLLEGPRIRNGRRKSCVPVLEVSKGDTDANFPSETVRPPLIRSVSFARNKRTLSCRNLRERKSSFRSWISPDDENGDSLQIPSSSTQMTSGFATNSSPTLDESGFNKTFPKTSARAFRTLREPLRMKVKAFKDKIGSGRSGSMTDLHCSRPMHNAKNESTYDKIVSKRKELFLTLNFLEDIVEKNKLEMIAGTASVIVDQLFQLIQQLRFSDASPASTRTLTKQNDAVYATISDLLKWCDYMSLDIKYKQEPRNLLNGDSSSSLPQLARSCRIAISNLVACSLKHINNPGEAAEREFRRNSLNALTAGDYDSTDSPYHHQSSSLSMQGNSNLLDPNRSLPTWHSSFPCAPGLELDPVDSMSSKSREDSPPPLPPRKSNRISPCSLDSGFQSVTGHGGTGDSNGIMDISECSPLKNGNLSETSSPNFDATDGVSDPNEEITVETIVETVGNKIISRTITKRVRKETRTSYHRVVSGESNSPELSAGAPLAFGEENGSSDDETPPPLPPRKATSPLSTPFPSDAFHNGTCEGNLGPEEKVTFRTVNLVHHKQSREQKSKHLFVNDKLVASASECNLKKRTLTAEKSEVVENDHVTHLDGSGTFDEEAHMKRSVTADAEIGLYDNVAAGEDGGRKKSPPPVPPKKFSVAAYIRIVGSRNGDEGNAVFDSDFRNSALASYAILRDKWATHEEAKRKHSVNFRFSSHQKSTPCQSKGVNHDYQNFANLLGLCSNDELKPRASLSSTSGSKCIEWSQETAKPVLPERISKALSLSRDLILAVDVTDYLIFSENVEDDIQIRGGIADALIVFAARPCSDHKDFLYQECFLTTFRSFVTSEDLIEKLIKRYKAFHKSQDPSKTKASKHAFALLTRVVDDLGPTEASCHIMKRLSDFVHAMTKNGDLALSKLLRQKILEKSDEVDKPHGFTFYPPPQDGKVATLLDFKSELLAEQMTYLDSVFFQKIELCEVLHWSKEQSEERCPNLVMFTEHFNKMSFWARTRVIEHCDTREREKYFLKFIRIMKHLRKLGNFNSYLALLSALDSSPISRLDWSKSLVEELAEHSALIDSSQSFKAYRMALAETKPPCLPYLGLILQDLTFVHIGNKDLLTSDAVGGKQNAINFTKRWQQFTILDNFRKFKSWTYDIEENSKVLSFFNCFDDYVDEDGIWDISKKIKPRGSTKSTLTTDLERREPSSRGDVAECTIFWRLSLAARRQTIRPELGYYKQPKDFANRH